MEGDVNTIAKIAEWGVFQSTPSAWRETRIDKNYQPITFISIHSLRMEGDIYSFVVEE